jgi:hypothetical protein
MVSHQTAEISMPSSDEYRLRAENCTRRAAACTDPVERDLLLQLASQWQKLAEHKAKQEAPQSPEVSS